MKSSIALHNIVDELVKPRSGDVQDCNAYDNQRTAWRDAHTPTPQRTNRKHK